MLFDKIQIQIQGSPTFYFSPEEFIQLPVNERVRMILKGNFRFYLKGIEVDKRDSLVALRKWTANSQIGQNEPLIT
jgi:hypothetical protein